jgi:hypothetical protein
MSEEKIACVDLDGVLAKYDGFQGVVNIGDPVEGAKEFVKDLNKVAKIVIYTTRCKGDFDKDRILNGHQPSELSAEERKAVVEQWLRKHGIPYDEVYIGQGKPFANCYIDDRAVSCESHKYGPHEFDLALVHAKRLCRDSN